MMLVGCCRFKLKALAGHSKAGQKVTYGVLKGAKFKQLALVILPCRKRYCTTAGVSSPIHAGSWSGCVQQATDDTITHGMCILISGMLQRRGLCLLPTDVDFCSRKD